MVSDMAVHRALASPVRSQLLRSLREAGAPTKIGRLAAEFGLHPNTVRAHLAILEHANLVVSTRDQPNGPGRPGLVYRASAAERSGSGVAYRMLATLLADHVGADHPEGGRLAEDAAAWGHRLALAGTPGSPDASGSPSEDQLVHRLLELMASLGFASSVDGDLGSDAWLETSRCPLREVVTRHPDVACAVHCGLVRGALDALGGDVEVLEPIDSGDDGPCSMRLRWNR